MPLRELHEFFFFFLRTANGQGNVLPNFTFQRNFHEGLGSNGLCLQLYLKRNSSTGVFL